MQSKCSYLTFHENLDLGVNKHNCLITCASAQTFVTILTSARLLGHVLLLCLKL